MKKEWGKMLHKAGGRMMPAFCLMLLLEGCAASSAGRREPVLTEEQKKEEMTYIQMQAAGGMDDAVRDETSALIKERIRNLAGDTEYFLEEEGDVMEVWMEASVFGSESVTEMLRAFVMRPGAFYLTDKAGAIEDLEAAVLLGREDIESAEIVDAVPESIPIENMPVVSKSGTYLKLVLTDAYVKAHEDDFASWGPILDLLQDTEMVLDGSTDEIIIYYAYPDHGGKELYVCSDSEDPGKLENLTWFSAAPVLPGKYSAWTLEAVDWLSPEDMGDGAGSFQTGKGEITGTWCRLDLEPFSGSMTEEEREAALTCIAGRLDTLERPYALGVSKTGCSGIYAALGTERIGSPVLKLLGSAVNPAVEMEENMARTIEGAVLVPSEDADGNLNGLILDASEDGKDLVSRITDDGYRRGYDKVTLYHPAYSKPLASGTITGPEGTGIIRFTDNAYLSEDPVTEEDRWFWNFVMQTFSDELPVSLNTTYLVYREDGSFGDASDFGIHPGE